MPGFIAQLADFTVRTMCAKHKREIVYGCGTWRTAECRKFWYIDGQYTEFTMPPEQG